MIEILHPGDKVLDKEGDMVIQYWGSDFDADVYDNRVHSVSYNAGLLSDDEFIQLSIHRSRIRFAYYENKPLPPGAIIVWPSVEEIEAVEPRIPPTIYLDAIRHARIAQQAKTSNTLPS